MNLAGRLVRIAIGIVMGVVLIVFLLVLLWPLFPYIIGVFLCSWPIWPIAGGSLIFFGGRNGNNRMRILGGILIVLWFISVCIVAALIALFPVAGIISEILNGIQRMNGIHP